MSEKLEIFDLDNEPIAIQDRKDYELEIFNEYQSTGAITKKVKAIRLVLMTSQGRIYLQKRSRSKKTNPGLLDKTIGGHVSAGHSYSLTVVKECAEELGFPSSVLDTAEFKKAAKVTNMQIIGIIRLIEILDDFVSKRELGEGNFLLQPYITGIYYGYYDGPIRFVDGESCGIESFSLEELKTELTNHPERFTDDLRFMIEKYGDLFVPVKDIK